MQSIDYKLFGVIPCCLYFEYERPEFDVGYRGGYVLEYISIGDYVVNFDALPEDLLSSIEDFITEKMEG